MKQLQDHKIIIYGGCIIFLYQKTNLIEPIKLQEASSQLIEINSAIMKGTSNIFHSPTFNYFELRLYDQKSHLS